MKYHTHKSNSSQRKPRSISRGHLELMFRSESLSLPNLYVKNMRRP